jgi:hypothetical protein
MDVLIDKPARLRGYALHRIVEQFRQGKPALWVDEGDRLRVRPCDAQPPVYEIGRLLGFTTTSCVALRAGRKHRYLPLADWRGRREWLEKEGARHGFEVVGVHVVGGMQQVQTHDGRRFTVDATEFTGLLRVTDPAAFSRCLVQGIGRVGKAFGLNLLIVH